MRRMAGWSFTTARAVAALWLVDTQVRAKKGVRALQGAMLRAGNFGSAAVASDSPFRGAIREVPPPPPPPMARAVAALMT